MGVPATKRGTVKRVIKDGLYAICYGMKEKHLPGQIALWLTNAGQDKGLARRFLSVPLVAALLPARTKALAKIAADGGAESPYGKWCAVDSTRDAASVMADIAQAWELKLIAPAFRLAKETDDFTIALYQFDGFSVHFTRRAEAWKKRLTECVNEEAKRWNIATSLEWDESTRPCLNTEVHSVSSLSSLSSLSVPFPSYSLLPLLGSPLPRSSVPSLPIISPTGYPYRENSRFHVHKVAETCQFSLN
jgi:hypothetical protein